MSIFGFMYYLCTYITARYNLIYGHTTQHDGGGASWPAVFECACVSLGLFQLTTAGIFILVRSYVASGILVLLFVFTFIFWWLCSTHFTRISYGGSMERCVAVPPPTVASHRTALPPNGVHLLYQAKCFVPPPPPTHPPKLSFDVNVHAALPPPKEVQVIDVMAHDPPCTCSSNLVPLLSSFHISQHSPPQRPCSTSFHMSQPLFWSVLLFINTSQSARLPTPAAARLLQLPTPTPSAPILAASWRDAVAHSGMRTPSQHAV
eukprot:CAMPEP_0196655538 /NCGR_PEP_ID=MMETSP1086-20130531/5292_1 /TAXON_ID=77921 /ORGANISM="Cyanoptyche  gloeocystis , Strain SAG4.97" /LENGTH=261 /DNA_ID=CAMNT_0041987903 /DNA_START=41 /DNA_END=827 /DNA_ORIENTATION=+